MPRHVTDGETEGGCVYTAALSDAPERAVERVAAAAESWGGEWQFAGPVAGKLILPVSAGVRRGWIGFEVAATATEDGARLELRAAQEHLFVDKATVMVLVIALCGALLMLAAPFSARLLALLPVGFLLAIAGWLFVVARLRNSGPEEFLEQVCLAEDDAP